MKSLNTPEITWIAPAFEGTSDGSYEAPFTDINKVLNNAKPGTTIVLKEGEYTENVNIQNSGTITLPIKVFADKKAKSPILCSSTWFLYDVSDIIISGLLFKDIPQQALSVIGNCERNNFNNLHFVNCGLESSVSCSLFLGGTGATCNVIEECSFEIEAKNERKQENANIPVGLMLSEGDMEDRKKLNTNHVIRNNRFRNYGCAAVIGTKGDNDHSFNHLFENNYIEHCIGDGIRVNCGGTSIRGNVIKHCLSNGIDIIQGKADIISDNRVEQCGRGINVGGYDGTLKNNCIVESTHEAITITAKTTKENLLRGTTIIEQNTCVENSDNEKRKKIASVTLETNSNCIIRRNLFSGLGIPYSILNGKAGTNKDATLFIVENVVINGKSSKKGCTKKSVAFAHPEEGDFSTESDFGASGWMVEGDTIVYPKGESDRASLKKSKDATKTDPVEAVIGDVDEKELYVRSLFMEAEMEAIDEEESSDEMQSEGGMIDFSDWD